MAALFYLEYKFISQLFTVLRLLQLSLSAGPGRHQHKSKSSAELDDGLPDVTRS